MSFRHSLDITIWPNAGFVEGTINGRRLSQPSPMECPDGETAGTWDEDLEWAVTSPRWGALLEEILHAIYTAEGSTWQERTAALAALGIRFDESADASSVHYGYRYDPVALGWSRSCAPARLAGCAAFTPPHAAGDSVSFAVGSLDRVVHRGPAGSEDTSRSGIGFAVIAWGRWTPGVGWTYKQLGSFNEHEPMPPSLPLFLDALVTAALIRRGKFGSYGVPYSCDGPTGFTLCEALREAALSGSPVNVSSPATNADKLLSAAATDPLGLEVVISGKGSTLAPGSANLVYRGEGSQGGVSGVAASTLGVGNNLTLNELDGRALGYGGEKPWRWDTVLTVSDTGGGLVDVDLGAGTAGLNGDRKWALELEYDYVVMSGEGDDVGGDSGEEEPEDRRKNLALWLVRALEIGGAAALAVNQGKSVSAAVAAATAAGAATQIASTKSGKSVAGKVRSVAKGALGATTTALDVVDTASDYVPVVGSVAKPVTNVAKTAVRWTRRIL